MFKYFCTALLFVSLHAQQFNEAENIEKKSTLNTVVLTDELNSDLPNYRKKGFVANSNEIVLDENQINKRLADKFIGKPLTDELILDLQKELSLYFKDEGSPFTAVIIPDQKIEEGVVQIELKESCIDKVICSNNRWFSNWCVTRKFTLKEGDVCCCERIMDDIAWIDRNPFLCAEAVFSPGEDPYTTCVEIKVNDRCPFDVFVGADNTGNKFTGNARIFAGATWGNAFFMGDILSYQFSTTDQYQKFYGHFGQYIMFLPWKNSLNVYGGYSRTQPNINDFNSAGTFGQVSARYTIPFKPLYKPPFYEIAFGVDWKSTNNNLNFISDGEPVIVPNTVDIWQYVGSFTYGNICGCHELSANVEVFYSPGNSLHSMSDSLFSTLRAGAVTDYVYTRVAVSDIWQLACCWKAYGLIRGQWSSNALLPSEQYGLGGYDTVRGYDEREYNADNAVNINLEVRTPDFSYCGKRFFNKHRLYFLAFFDYGHGHLKYRIEGQPLNEDLASLGLGFRYFLCDKLSVRGDYGFKLTDTDLGGSDLGKFHVGAFLVF